MSKKKKANGSNWAKIASMSHDWLTTNEPSLILAWGVEKTMGKDEILKIATDGIQEQIRPIREDFERRLANDKASLINVFGIFASIVTFISIEIQILKQICDFWRLLGFSAFILAWLLSFVFILQYVMKSWIEDDKSVPIHELFTGVYWKSLRINFSIILASLTIIFLFCFSYKALSNAPSEYACQTFEMRKDFDDLRAKLEKMEFEKYQQLDIKTTWLENQIDVLRSKK